MLAIPHIMPVAQALRNRGDEVFWSFRESVEWNDWPAAKDYLEKKGWEVKPEETESDFCLHADPRFCPRNGAPVFELPHGINSKTGFFLPTVAYEVDYHLAASEWIADRMKQWHPQTKFIPVGIPKLDGFKKGGDSILICCTHQENLTLWLDCRDEILKMNEKIILRFHRFVLESKKHWLKNLDVEIDFSDSIVESFNRAKVVVGDISSATMEALGLGLPVVRYESAGAKEHLKKPYILEGEFSDYVTRIDSPKDILRACEDAKPAPLEIQKRLIINQGRATQAAVKAIDGEL